MTEHVLIRNTEFKTHHIGIRENRCQGSCGEQPSRDDSAAETRGNGDRHDWM